MCFLGIVQGLFRQSELLMQRPHARITANEAEFRIGEVPAYTHGAHRLHALQRLNRALVVAHPGVRQGLNKRVRGLGGKILRIATPACASICVTQVTTNS